MEKLSKEQEGENFFLDFETCKRQRLLSAENGWSSSSNLEDVNLIQVLELFL